MGSSPGQVAQEFFSVEVQLLNGLLLLVLAGHQTPVLCGENFSDRGSPLKHGYAMVVAVVIRGGGLQGS